MHVLNQRQKGSDGAKAVQVLGLQPTRHYPYAARALDAADLSLIQR